MTPAYLRLYQDGELKNRIHKLYSILENCTLCPRKCGVNRLKDEKGYCRSGKELSISSYGPHFGEEDPLVGDSGSGTIFLASCNLLCVYCQNYDISHEGYGKPVSEEEVADFMIDLQKRGCHNINFVSPSHVVPQIMAGVLIAAQAGLSIPLVYNTGGYDSQAMLTLLDGIFDIYMPDMKYADHDIARNYSKIRNYPQANQAAVREMHRQVEDLVLDGRGVALRGLLVRHLVLPEGLAGTPDIARFLAEEVSRDTYVNVMDQYRPCHKAGELPPLDRRTSKAEHRQAMQQAGDAGLHRFDRRELRVLRISGI